MRCMSFVCHAAILISCVLSVQSETCHRRLFGAWGLIQYPDIGGDWTELPEIYKQGIDEETECVYFTALRHEMSLTFENKYPDDIPITVEVNTQPYYSRWDPYYDDVNSTTVDLYAFSYITRVIIPKRLDTLSLFYSVTFPDGSPDCSCENWTTTNWTKCSYPCAVGEKSRSSYCEEGPKCFEADEKEPCNIERCDDSHKVECYRELNGSGYVNRHEYHPKGSLSEFYKKGLRKDHDCLFFAPLQKSTLFALTFQSDFHSFYLPVLIESHDGGQNSGWQLGATVGGNLDYGPFFCEVHVQISDVAYFRMVFPQNMIHIDFSYAFHDCECVDKLYGEWSDCSASCGGGRSFRSWNCSHDLNDLCRRELEEKPCNWQPCEASYQAKLPVGNVLTFPWTPCSTSCIGGIRMRFRVMKDFDFIEKQSCGTYHCRGKRSLPSEEVETPSRSPVSEYSREEFGCPELPSEVATIGCDVDGDIFSCRFRCKTGVPRFINLKIYPEFEAECRTFSSGEKTWVPAIHQANCLSKEDVILECLVDVNKECQYEERSLLAWFDGYDEEQKNSTDPFYALGTDKFKLVDNSSDERISVEDPLFCPAVWSPITIDFNMKRDCPGECGKKCGERKRQRICLICQVSKASPCKRLDASVS